MQSGLKKETVDKYLKAVRAFVGYCAEEGVQTIHTFPDLDQHLADFIQYLHDGWLEQLAGCNKSTAANAIHGVVMLIPRAEYEVPTARRAYRNWKRAAAGVSYPPITKDLAVLVAANMMSRGKERHALGTLLAFDCCLRVSELTGLRKEDVADAGDSRMGSGYSKMAVRLRHTKTGPNKFVALRDQHVVRLMRRALAETPSGSWLFPFTSDNFRYQFKTTCARLGLSSDYVPHSLRHGGATHMFLKENKSIEFVMHHGRWASTKSARHYIQTGRSLLFDVKVPARSAAAGAVLARDVVTSLMAARGVFLRKHGL